MRASLDRGNRVYSEVPAAHEGNPNKSEGSRGAETAAVWQRCFPVRAQLSRGEKRKTHTRAMTEGKVAHRAAALGRKQVDD